MIKFTSSLLVFLLLISPDLVGAAGFVPCGSSGEPSCTFCHFVGMMNTIIVWLIGILFVIFAFLMFSAGWGLLTSGGNQAERNQAKEKFTNGIIGIAIVLGAWLIVDIAMNAMLGPGGEIGGYGPWATVKCYEAETPTIAAP